MVKGSSFLLAQRTVGRIGLGTWALGGGNDWGPACAAQSLQVIAAALEAGINWIDTAPIYGEGEAECLLGRALKGCRHQVLLATKCGIILKNGRPDHDLRAESIAAQCEASLQRLKTDYIDLYQIHWPDPHVPLSEAVETLFRLQKQGKIRAVGLCNVHISQLQAACEIGPVDCVQNPLSLLDCRQTEVLHFCQTHQIPFCAYGALGGGILSAKYKQEPNFRRCDARRYFYKYYFGNAFTQAQLIAARVKNIAAHKNVPASAVALAWVLAQNGVSGVLAGARSAEQIRQNIPAVALRLSEAERRYLQAGDLRPGDMEGV